MSDSIDQPASSWMATSWWRNAVVALLLLGIGFICLHIFNVYLSMPLTIVLLAIMLTYLLQPVVDRMAQRRVAHHAHTARIVAVLLLYLAIALAFYGVISITANTLKSDVGALESTWQSAREKLPQQIADLKAWYLNYVPPTLREQLESGLKQAIDQAAPKFIAGLTGIARATGHVGGLLIELIFVPLVAFYLLTDAPKIRQQVLAFVPQRHREPVSLYAAAINRIMRQYVLGQLILCGIAWIVVTIALLLMGIPGALLLGIIAGVSRAIPVIGPVVGGVPLLAAVLFNAHWIGAFWWVLIGFTLLHLFESKILMPRILGDQIGVHPVLVIISLLIGYELLGLLGMFLAPPGVAIIQFVLAVRRGERALDGGAVPAIPVPDAQPA